MALLSEAERQLGYKIARLDNNALTIEQA